MKSKQILSLRVVFSALSLLLISVPAFSNPTTEVPYTVIESTPCSELLAGNELINVIRLLMKSVTERSSEAHGETVASVIQRAKLEREKAKNVFIKFQGSAVVQGKIKKHLHELEFTPRNLEDLHLLQNKYGQEIIPVGPRPLAPEVFEQWQPIYLQLRALGIHSQLRGHFGEWIAATLLPDTIKLNVHAKGALTHKEAGLTMKVQGKISKAYWDWYNKKHNEVDIVFNNGQSIGEIKFNSETTVSENRKDDMMEQAYKFFRLREIWRAAGIAPRDFYFIFIENLPDDEKLLRYIHDCDIKIILIKIK